MCNGAFMCMKCMKLKLWQIYLEDSRIIRIFATRKNKQRRLLELTL